MWGDRGYAGSFSVHISSAYPQTILLSDPGKLFITAILIKQAYPPVESVQLSALGHGFRPASGGAALPPGAGAAFRMGFLEFALGICHFAQIRRISKQLL